MSINQDNILTRALEKKISRRSFVKWSAALGATASMSGLVMQTGAKMASGQVYKPAAGVGGTIVDWKPTICLVCHSWCHIACGVDNNGHIRKIEGGGGQPKNYADGTTPIKPLTCTTVGFTTTLAAGVLIGDPTITLTATVGLSDGMRLTVGTGGGAETLTIAIGGIGGGGVITTTTPATKVHAISDPVAGDNWSGGNIVATVATKPDDHNHIATGNGYLTYAPHNKGRICAKGNDGVEHLYDPDRIKYPLRRVAGRGEGQWQRISWDTALTEIANVLRELAGVTTNVDLTPNGGRGQDLRHRFVNWIGRNENFAGGNFTKAYGSPNHVEHTSLCELGRHVAGRTLWGHHWSSVDMEVHTDGFPTPWPATGGENGPGGNLTLNSNIHDIDCYIEWGGNPCEAKIPHSTWANHLGDRRKRNLQGFSDAKLQAGGAPYASTTTTRTGTVYGRVLCIDVRQSNTAAWADEYFKITPGTDGALALGLIRYVMQTVGVGTLQAELDKGHMGGRGASAGKTAGDPGYDANLRLYYGIFKTEEDGGVASGTIANNAVPTGKSLESYVYDAGKFSQDIGLGAGVATLAQIRTKVCAMCGITDEADFNYLGSLFANGAGGQFLNVVCDTYRGPVKHTNGVYNTRAIRALQILAPNYSAGQWGALMGYVGAPTVSRGGYNAPGGFQSDKNWNPWNAGGGPPGGGGNPGAATNWKAGLPVDQGMTPPMSDYQRVDDWDYDYDVPRWRGAYARVDQNLSPGIRHSVGMHAFVMGSPKNAAIKGPFYWKNWQDQNEADPSKKFDPTFKVEAMLIHKNAPGYARPQQNNEVELLTDKNPDGSYRLAHFWAIDIAMGDGTRFADIILPESTYLERYSRRSGEGCEFNYRETTFFRIPVYESMVDAGLSANVPRHIYDVRQNSAIFYELARKIEPGGATSGAKIATAGNGDPLWNGKLYDSFNWAPGAGNSVATTSSALNDGEYAIRAYWDGQWNNAALNAAATAAGAANGADYMRSHGHIYNSNDRPAYWRAHFDGDDGAHANSTYVPKCNYKAPNGTLADIAGGKSRMLTVFNKLLDTVPDMVRSNGTKITTFGTKADGTFFGGPVYVPTIQQTSVAFPLHLTTYKVNVHTQSRTACLPRLTEILGNSWAVIHPTTAAAYGGIVNGDTILVSSETGGIEAVAKVSEKAQVGCVHISHSFGHRKGVMSVDSDEGNPNRAAFGEYLVNGAANRSQDTTLNNPAPSPCDAWALALPPSAPGKGTHCNIVIAHHLNGDAGTGKNIATDPIGGDQAWFDTKVKIEKI